MQRISLNGVAADNVFRWQDDLNFAAAKDSKNPTNGDRPMPVFDASGNVQSVGVFPGPLRLPARRPTIMWAPRQRAHPGY